MNFKWLCFIFFMQFAMMAYCNSVKRELVMVQVLFRHGARYTIHGELLTNNQRQEEIVRNKGELTSVGMRQLYLLGSKLRKELLLENKLLSSNEFNSSEVHVQSSNVNRALQSAQSFLQGFFPSSESQILPQNVPNNLLIPPYLYSENDEKLFVARTSDNLALPSKIYPYIIHSNGDHEYAFNNPCPNEKAIKKRQLEQNQDVVMKEINKYSYQINEIVRKLQIKGNFVGANITKIQDIAISLKYLGVLSGLTTEEYDLIQFLKAYTKTHIIFTPEYSKLYSSPTIDYILKAFNQKVSGESNLKLIVESTHDSQLIPLMMTFGMLNSECLKKDFESKTSSCEKFPKYSSNFLFELYKNFNTSEFEVKVKYNGNYIQICGGQLICTLQQFNDWLQPKLYSPQEYAEICGTIEDPYQPINSNTNQSTIIIVILSILALGFAVAFSYSFYMLKKFKEEQTLNYRKYRDNQVEL